MEQTTLFFGGGEGGREGYCILCLSQTFTELCHRHKVVLAASDFCVSFCWRRGTLFFLPVDTMAHTKKLNTVWQIIKVFV